jgi:phospholipase C
VDGHLPIERPRFLAGAAGLAGVAALGVPRSSRAAAVLPDPDSTGIHHSVLMMENRSFDHYRGWLPGADRKRAGLSYIDAAGASHPTYHLTDYQGCAHPDPTTPTPAADATAGTLSAVSFLDLRFLEEDSGTSADDHPHADIRAGQYFLHQVYQAVTTSPLWPRTALVINYDEWGGFFDHVPPVTAPTPGPTWAPGCAASAPRACSSRPEPGVTTSRTAPTTTPRC